MKPSDFDTICQRMSNGEGFEAIVSSLKLNSDQVANEIRTNGSYSDRLRTAKTQQKGVERIRVAAQRSAVTVS